MDINMDRIAVWNTAFLGDAVLTLPLLQNLRQHYPNAVIDFYVRSGLASLFQNHPALTNVIEYDKRNKEKGPFSLISFGQRVAEKRYSVWISAHTSVRSGLIALASRAPLRIGYDKPAHNALWYTERVARQFDKLDEIERLLELLTPLRVPVTSTWPELVLHDEAQTSAARFFSSLRSPVLGLHPGSVWETKRWPAECFAEVGVQALKKGASVLIFAGKGEENVAEQVFSAIQTQVGASETKHMHNLAGKLSLPELVAYLGSLSCYVTNDSGPMHLAWAQRTPVTAVFGPTVRSLGFYPRGDATVLEVDLPCRPCGLHGHTKCPLGHHLCMKKVLPDDVWKDVEEKLFAVQRV